MEVKAFNHTVVLAAEDTAEHPQARLIVNDFLELPLPQHADHPRNAAAGNP